MDIFKSNIAVGIGAAFLATLVAPVIVPVIATAGRPLAKTLIKSGIMVYERSREVVANAGEVMEDLIAEVRTEEAARRSASAGAGATSDSTGGRASGPLGGATRAQGNGSEQNMAQREAGSADPNSQNGIAM